MLVLEPWDDAVARGAHIVCEVAGYGASADAHHLTDPDPSGVPQARALTRGPRRTPASPPIRWTTSTRTAAASKPGDPAEVRMLQLALGEEVAARVAVSATKSMHGHCMGATGALEAAITALALQEGLMPPTLNLHEIDEECIGVDHVANTARPADIRVAMSTSFGLGGHNAALALTRADENGA